jgi:hypothetical protein
MQRSIRSGETRSSAVTGSVFSWRFRIAKKPDGRATYGPLIVAVARSSIARIRSSRLKRNSHKAIQSGMMAAMVASPGRPSQLPTAVCSSA